MWDILFEDKVSYDCVCPPWCEGYMLWTMLWAKMACTKYHTPIRWGKYVWQANQIQSPAEYLRVKLSSKPSSWHKPVWEFQRELILEHYTIRWSRVGAIVILPSRLRWIGECAALIQLADHIGSPIISSRTSAMHSEDCRDKAKYGFYCHLKTVRHLHNAELFMVSRE